MAANERIEIHGDDECTCGHPRNHHFTQPPHECNAQLWSSDREQYADCRCDGFEMEVA